MKMAYQRKSGISSKYGSVSGHGSMASISISICENNLAMAKINEMAIIMKISMAINGNNNQNQSNQY
jgi:hypothetical protein